MTDKGLSESPEPPTYHTPANHFLQTEVYRLGAQPGLRSLPPGPERDFLTLTWGPVVFRTTYAPDSQRLFLLFLRGLNECIRRSLPRVLPGSPAQQTQLEQCYSSKVFSSQETMHGVAEGVVKELFHDWKVALGIPAITLPIRLRVALVVDDAVLARMTLVVDEASRRLEDADLDGCPVKIVEENFPDVERKEIAVGELYPGWTTVTMGALMEVYDGLRGGKGLANYHRKGRVYLGEGKWS